MKTPENGMPLIRCTQKLLKDLPFPIVEIQNGQENSLLGDWHANLLIIERRKCVVFMNDKTFYSLFIPGLTKADFKRLPEIFLDKLLDNLDYCALSEYREKIISEYDGKIRFGKTNNKSVLGCLSDIKYAIHNAISRQGGLNHLNFKEVARYINAVPRHINNFHTATEVFIGALRGLTGKDIPIIPLTVYDEKLLETSMKGTSAKPRDAQVSEKNCEMSDLTHRRATVHDLPLIVELLAQDDLGTTRETLSKELDSRYLDAFDLINGDLGQYLMIVEHSDKIVATCHLTLMPSLTFMGSTRLQIEAVRVSMDTRGQGVGEWMIKQAIDYGKSQGATIIQLTTNKKRPRAKQFYERLGFKASHVGLKLLV